MQSNRNSNEPRQKFNRKNVFVTACDVGLLFRFVGICLRVESFHGSNRWSRTVSRLANVFQTIPTASCLHTWTSSVEWRWGLLFIILLEMKTNKTRRIWV